MGRSLSPIVRRELENLDKDSDSRKSAMKALKSYVKDLDSKAIPIFLAQVSETKQTGISSGEHTISLYEVLARVHGPKIAPQIDNIMSSIVKTLSLSGGAFALHQACSKVVPAIARYGIDPTTSVDGKRHIIHSLCKPLSDCLLDSNENLSSGAALCLQTLVESDNWRFTSNEMVNEVCQRVAGALEKHSHINSHMALVTTLAKHNSQIVEAYARLLIQSGLKILDGFLDANSQKQFTAIHMVSSLMRSLDPKSILPEMELVIKEMEKCQSDRMPFVTGAAVEALQIAKRICAATGSNRARTPNRDRRESPRSNAYLREEFFFPASPESHSVIPSFGYDDFMESPKLVKESHQSVGCDNRSVNRKLWQRKNGVLDVSLKDGIFSEITEGSDAMSSEHDAFSRKNYHEKFAGFVQESAENGFTGGRTPSPERSNACINIDEMMIFTTPRKLIRSLQLDDYDSGIKNHHDIFRASKFAQSPSLTIKQNGLSQEDDKLSSGCTQQQFSESVSSTEDVVFTNQDPFLSKDIAAGSKSQLEREVVDVEKKKQFNSAYYRIACGFFVALFAAFLYLLAMVDGNEHHVVVPT